MKGKETRSKISEYMKPSPQGAMASRNIDASNDIYDHTAQFFDKS